MAIKISPVNSDFSIRNGKFELTTGRDSTADRLRVRMRVLLGEWYLDPTLGIPYYTQILGSSVNSRALSSYLRKAILKDVDVDQITKFEVFRSQTGSGLVSVNIDVLLISGETVSVGNTIQ